MRRGSAPSVGSGNSTMTGVVAPPAPPVATAPPPAPGDPPLAGGAPPVPCAASASGAPGRSSVRPHATSSKVRARRRISGTSIPDSHSRRTRRVKEVGDHPLAAATTGCKMARQRSAHVTSKGIVFVVLSVVAAIYLLAHGCGGSSQGGRSGDGSLGSEVAGLQPGGGGSEGGATSSGGM